MNCQIRKSSDVRTFGKDTGMILNDIAGKEYLAFFSGVKDSVATILLAHEHNEPLDEIIFCEVMYSQTVSGELPEHIDFVKNVAFPLFESWGYKTRILRSEKTYLDLFHRIVKRSSHPDRIGKMVGFPMAGKCAVNDYCKMKSINDYITTKNETGLIQYVGIAIDEPKRLSRLKGGKISLLEKYGYTEEMARRKALEYGLLSPCYEYSNRGGCWFCPNAGIRELKYLRNNYPDLWQELLNLEETPDIVGYMWNTLTKTSIHEMDKKLFMKDDRLSILDFLYE